MHIDPIRIPLRNRAGVITAFAVIDADDAHLAEHVWCLDARTSTRTGPPYVRRGVWRDGRRLDVSLHREVLGLKHGDRRKVDHRNGDTLDNRRANLRIATVAQNAQNQGSRGGSSQYRGVTWDKSRRKWMATAMLDGRRRTIGRFGTEEEANAAAVEWRARHMPYSQEAA